MLIESMPAKQYRKKQGMGAPVLKATSELQWWEYIGKCREYSR
jgi:hypothetical protein